MFAPELRNGRPEFAVCAFDFFLPSQCAHMRTPYRPMCTLDCIINSRRIRLSTPAAPCPPPTSLCSDLPPSRVSQPMFVHRNPEIRPKKSARAQLELCTANLHILAMSAAYAPTDLLYSCDVHAKSRSICAVQTVYATKQRQKAAKYARNCHTSLPMLARRLPAPPSARM